MQQVKEINEGRIAPFQNLDLHCFHEPADSEPEIIPYHHQALHPLAIALSEGLHQFGVCFRSFGMKPLLELIEDDQDFLPTRKACSSAQSGHRLDQPQVAR